MSIVPLLILAGAAIFLSGGSSKASSSTKKEDSPDEKDLNQMNFQDVSKKGRQGRPSCLPTEFLTKVEGKYVCKPFWIEGQTDMYVEKAIFEEIDQLKQKDWAYLCEDKEVGNMGKQFEENPILKQVVKNVIIRLWKESGILKKDLPPTSKSPQWVKEVWTRVRKIYRDKACFQKV